LVRAYFEADVVVSCPGNFIYSRSYLAGLPILMPLFTIIYAWFVGKPIYILPQTLGPLVRRWEHILLKWVLQKIHIILVRDLTSVELLERMSLRHSRCYLVSDLAFEFPGVSSDQAFLLLERYGIDKSQHRPLLGVTLIDWGAQNPAFRAQQVYEQGVAETILTFVEEQKGYVVIFPQVCGPKQADDDRIPARRVHEQLVGTVAFDRVKVIDEEYPAALLKATYGQMDLFLGSRLHSNIFAMAEGIPVIAIAYQSKTAGVMRMLGLEEWVIDIEQVDSKRLPKLYRSIWNRQQEVRVQVQAAVQDLVQGSHNHLRAVYQDMANISSKTH
jgi:colanic acid/amylovoran biosynthesis protein